MATFHDRRTPHISHVTLRVSSLDNSSRFYQDVLGLKVKEQNNERVVLNSKYGNILTLIKADKSQNFSEGLYHVAFLLPSMEALAKWFLYQSKRNFLIYGASDHLVSKAFYFNDPDGNGIEIYADTDPEDWDESRNGVHMDTLPLDINALVRGIAAPKELSGNIQIGHLHLKTKDVHRMQQFYHLLDFDVRLNMGHAIFMSFHQYHHHLAVNQWNYTRMVDHRDDDVDINDYTIQYPNEERLNSVMNRLVENNITVFNQDGQVFIYDPMNIKINLENYHYEQ